MGNCPNFREKLTFMANDKEFDFRENFFKLKELTIAI
jgi:hypothetical protein